MRASPQGRPGPALQEPQTSTHVEQRALLVFAALALAAAGMAALLALFPAGGHDQLWFLLMAQRWLAGAPLYGTQAFDSNPPAIVWLSAVPVTLGRLLHVPATLPAKCLVTLLGAACAALSFTFLPNGWRKPRRYEAAALLFAVFTLLYAVPARDFGQRDHLAGFLLLPYVLAAAVPPFPGASRAARMAAAVLAAVGVCLRPHDALVPACLEAVLLALPMKFTASLVPENAPGAPRVATANPGRRRSGALRLEPAVLLLAGAAYFFLIRRFAPLYLTQALPLTRQVYGAIGHLTLPQLLWEAIELCILAAAAAALSLRRTPSPPAVRLLLLAGAAAFAAYLIQGTGWYYQQLPAITFFGFALALELLDAAGAPPRVPVWAPRATAGLSLLALALTTHFTGYPFTQDRAFAIGSPDPALFRSLPAGTPVAILTTSVDEAMMPVERYRLLWAQRTNNLWLLPQVLRSERPEGQPVRHRTPQPQLRALDAQLHHWMVEDLDRWRPQLVLVERCQDEAVRCQVLEDRHDDLLAWFRTDPDFSALWNQHYKLLRTDARFGVYSRR